MELTHSIKGEAMHEGRIDRVVVDRGFGFIRSPGMDDTFFHVRSLIDLDFDERLRDLRVEFDIEEGPQGPRAYRVRAAD